MKLQFDPHQAFQIDAINAAADLFDGQPQAEPTFSVIKAEPGENFLSGFEQSELGVGNRLLLDDDALRANLRGVQRRVQTGWSDPPERV